MLIMTQEGSLVNIDHVVEIFAVPNDAEPNGEKWEVVAFATRDQPQDLSGITLATCDTEDTARRIISEIFSTYSQKIAVVDICEMLDKTISLLERAVRWRHKHLTPNRRGASASRHTVR